MNITIAPDREDGVKPGYECDESAQRRPVVRSGARTGRRAGPGTAHSARDFREVRVPFTASLPDRHRTGPTADASSEERSVYGLESDAVNTAITRPEPSIRAMIGAAFQWNWPIPSASALLVACSAIAGYSDPAPADHAEGEAEQAEWDQVLRPSRARVRQPEQNRDDQRRDPNAEPAAQHREQEAPEEELFGDRRDHLTNAATAIAAAVLLSAPSSLGSLSAPWIWKIAAYASDTAQ